MNQKKNHIYHHFDQSVYSHCIRSIKLKRLQSAQLTKLNLISISPQVGWRCRDVKKVLSVLCAYTELVWVTRTWLMEYQLQVLYWVKLSTDWLMFSTTVKKPFVLVISEKASLKSGADRSVSLTISTYFKRYF